MDAKKEFFDVGDQFVIDAEMYFTGGKFRYDPSKPERKVRPIKGQVKLGIEVSTEFNIECDRRKRYDYPLDTIFRLHVTVIRKSNKTAFYNYYDEYHLRSDNQTLQSINEYES